MFFYLSFLLWMIFFFFILSFLVCFFFFLFISWVVSSSKDFLFLQWNIALQNSWSVACSTTHTNPDYLIFWSTQSKNLECFQLFFRKLECKFCALHFFQFFWSAENVYSKKIGVNSCPLQFFWSGQFAHTKWNQNLGVHKMCTPHFEKKLQSLQKFTLHTPIFLKDWSTHSNIHWCSEELLHCKKTIS